MQFYKPTETPLDSADDLAGTQAAGADVDMSRNAVHKSLNAADIGLERSVGADVGVRHIDSEGNALTADFTLGHYTQNSFGIDLRLDRRGKNCDKYSASLPNARTV